MDVIILTFFACVWIGGVCWVLGFFQNKFQQLNNKFQRFKTEKE